MALVTLNVEFNDDGTATIRLPDGKRTVVDQAKLAEFTQGLAKKMGPIIETHALHAHSHLHDKPGEEHVHE